MTEPGSSSNTTDGPSGAMALFTPISHPILTSHDPFEIIKFMDKRTQYELQISEKQKEIPSLSPASFLVSVDPQLLRRMHFMGEFDEVAPHAELKYITSDNIKTVLETFVKNASSRAPDTQIIEAALVGLRTPTHITDASARIKQLVADYLKRMADIGYSTFKHTNPKMTVQHLTRALHPIALKNQIEKDIDYRPDLKKDVRKFIKHVAQQAEHIEKAKSFGATTKAPARVPGHPDSSGKAPAKGQTQKSSTSARTKNNMSKNDIKPLFLWPIHFEKGFRHFLRDCKACPEEEKPALIEKYKNEKKRNKGETKTVKSSEKHPVNDFIVSAIFGGAVESSLCTDSGSDINLIDKKLLDDMRTRGAVMEVIPLVPPHGYGLAIKNMGEDANIFVECTHTVKMTVTLSIRHGTGLNLRNKVWYVTNSETEVPLLGRHVLRALGLDPEKLLKAAFEKFGSEIDMNDVVPDHNHGKGTLAYIMNQGVFHSQGFEEDKDSTQLDEECFVNLGTDTPAELDHALNSLLSTASDNGMSPKALQRLKEVTTEYKDVFRIRLGNDAPANVEPMQIQLDHTSKPVIARTRRYSEPQRRFMDTYFDRLLEYGFVVPETNPTWAAAPLLVPKPTPTNFRLTLDLRPVNSATIPMRWPMPHVDSELLDLAKSKYFAVIDFVSGYWQLPVEESSQTYHSFITSRGVLRPTRKLQGGRNSAANFQSRVEPCFVSIREHLKAWLDDFLLHASTEQELIDIVEQFFKICRERNLKISVLKSILFALFVRWCARIIDGEGVKFEPSRLSGLLDISLPVTAEELSQFIYCTQWMCTSIPDYTKRIAPLRKVLEEAYTNSGRRTTKSIANLQLSKLSWGPIHEKAYRDLHESLKDAVKLSHRDTTKPLCIYTDASDCYWAAVVTQCGREELEKPTLEQTHEPLAFLSGEFKASDGRHRWTTFEKEAFAIFDVFKKLDYMLLSETEIHLYTDHRNLLFVFNPHVREPPLGRHKVVKVERWGLYLAKFQYVIEHVDGDKNVMADIMTRWLRGYRGQQCSTKTITHILESTDLAPSPNDDSFVWPDIEEIMAIQKEAKELNAEFSTAGLALKNGKIVIPPNAHDLQCRLLVVSHSSAKGNRGSNTTLEILREQYYWDSMQDDCKEFVRHCIHCLISSTGEKIPRPLAITKHATKPNEIVHFDFLFMGNSSTGKKYVLVLKDDLSGYLWLVPVVKCEALEVSKAMMDWIQTFTEMSYWIPDQGSHFKNQVMNELASQLKINHHFVVAYSPLANGTVERVMREVLPASRALLSEFKLAPQDWPEVLSLVQRVLNESPLVRLGRNEDGSVRTPLRAMTGIRPGRTNFIFGTELRNMEQAKAVQIMALEDIQHALDEMHKDVSQRSTKNRMRQIASHNRKTNIIAPNFHLGDFVLLRRAQDKGHKLANRWVGPRRVTKVINELVYEISLLDGTNPVQAHASRLLIYREGLTDEASDKLKRQAVHLETKYEVIERLLDIRKINGELYIQVQWLGLPDPEDFTLQNLDFLQEDIPDMLKGFLKSCHKKNLAAQALSLITA